jgi:DNA-binding response OmpR family regulator
VESQAVRLLVAEDDEDIRVLIERAFSFVGVQVVAVGNGAEALTGIETVDPHCLVLDLRMPDVDGMQVLSAMRSSGATVPAVMLTASVESEIEADALEMGAFAVVRKPFQTRALLTVVARAIRSASPDLVFPERFATATQL